MKGRGHIARTGGKLHHTDRQIGSHRGYTEHFHHLQHSTLCGNTAHWSHWKGIHTVATTCYCLATCTETPDDVDKTEASLKTGRTLEKQLIEHEPQWWEMTRRMGLGLGLGLGLGIIFNVGKPLARRLLIQAPPSHHWFCPQQVERHGSAPFFTSAWPTTWPSNVRLTTPLWWPGWDAESHLHYWDLLSGSARIPKLYHCSGSSGCPTGVQRELHPLTDSTHYNNHWHTFCTINLTSHTTQLEGLPLLACVLIVISVQPELWRPCTSIRHHTTPTCVPPYIPFGPLLTWSILDWHLVQYWMEWINEQCRNDWSLMVGTPKSKN